MVTNSFGKRNAMQPMGRPKHALKAPCFLFLFSFEGAGEGFFFIFTWFPMCSHYVPFRFPMGFQYVPQVPNVFPNMFFIAPNFFPICFGKCCPPFTYIGAPKGINSILQNRTFYFGEPPYFHFFSDGRIKSARCKKK